MVFRIALLWIVGLATIVPYSIYYLLYYAQRDEYALLIVVPLFWIFGFWGIVGPILAIIRVRKLMRALESAHGWDQVKLAFERNEGEEVIIDLIASENRIPKVLARMTYRLVLRRLSVQAADAPSLRR